MTRLVETDIQNISAELNAYDEELRRKTGRTLLGVACHALSRGESAVRHNLSTQKVAVVPITTGKGIIGGFSRTVADIIKHIGIHVFVTGETDVSGIADALNKKADVIFMADDRRFVAINTRKSLVVDNSEATGKGFVAGLDLMANGLSGKNVLVLGCGPVGCWAALEAKMRGADVSVYDIVPEIAQKMARKLMEKSDIEVTVEPTLPEALEHCNMVIDATNAADVISGEDLKHIDYIAAPGMPLGINKSDINENSINGNIEARLLHDPLQIGVAVMALLSLIVGHQVG